MGDDGELNFELLKLRLVTLLPLPTFLYVSIRLFSSFVCVPLLFDSETRSLPERHFFQILEC